MLIPGDLEIFISSTSISTLNEFGSGINRSADVSRH